jgi:anti-sigma regulatory factor (Ser/Thr protein kinase)
MAATKTKSTKSQTLSYDLPGGPEAAPAARRTIDRILRRYCTPETAARLRLLVTELATNGVRHGESDRTGRLGLHIVLESDVVRIELVDFGGGFKPTTPLPQPGEEGGFGLVLVDSLADRWGVDSGDSTRVWFEVDRAGVVPGAQFKA